MQPTAHRDVIFAESHRREQRIFNWHVISQQLRLHEPRRHACDSNRLSISLCSSRSPRKHFCLPSRNSHPPSSRRLTNNDRLVAEHFDRAAEFAARLTAWRDHVKHLAIVWLVVDLPAVPSTTCFVWYGHRRCRWLCLCSLCASYFYYPSCFIAMDRSLGFSRESCLRYRCGRRCRFVS